MMQRWGSPTRLNNFSQFIRQAVAQPSFLPKVFLALVLIGTSLFMAASDSLTYASPKVVKKGTPVASISPAPDSNAVVNIVPTDTATATPTGTPTIITPTPTIPYAPISSYTPPTTNTTTPTPTPTPTSTSSTPTPTPTPIATDTPTPTPTTDDTSADATATANAADTPTPTATSSSDDNDEDETPTATATDTSTVTPTDTATDTPTVTDTSTVTPTDTATDTPTVTDTSTVTPTVTDTSTVTPTNTVTPTDTPTPTPTATTGCITSTTSSTPTASVQTDAKMNSALAASPLLFGTNLALFNNQDEVLTSTQAQDCLQQMHISIIRIPTRSGVDLATIEQAAQVVQQLGDTPLIVLHGSVDTNAYQDDAAIIQAMNSIFGSNTVYYEYGNNEDLLQVSPYAYTQSWNANVPGLKQLATKGLFIGPVTYKYSPLYLHYFLEKANPRPDAISWHEYACSSTKSESDCYAGLSSWGSDVQGARHLMRSTIHTMLPVMITEWNYAANTTTDDGKNTDASFMSNWTATAIQILAQNHVFASMQYAATDTNTNLIDSSGALTAQGATMESEYETLVPSSSSPGTPGATPTPTPTPTDTVTPTATPVSDTSAQATPAVPAVTPSSSQASPSE